MPPYLISAADRTLFKQCRRSWDLSAQARQRLEPVDPAVAPSPAAVGPPPFAVDALRAALDVYYFPGMWEWDRAIVVPLAHQAIGRAVSEATDPPEPEVVESVHRALDAYARWAPTHDHFVPIEVAMDITVNIPDPVLADCDLTTDDGEPVRYACRLDALVFDEEDARPWLLCHRLGGGPWLTEAVTALDEAALTDCWAWEHTMLDARTAGVLVNEVDLVGPATRFRRLAVPHLRAAVTRAGRQVGREAVDMLDPGLSLYPNPVPSNCSVCPFVSPCRALRDGADAEPILRRAYRQRPAEQRWTFNGGERRWRPDRR